MKNYIILEIEPIPKPRITRFGVFSEKAQRYYKFKDDLKFLVKNAGYELKEEITGLTFILPMPGNWSKKKKKQMNRQPHQQKPDLDNLIKAFQDALLENDSSVWRYLSIKKLWGECGSIEIDMEV